MITGDSPHCRRHCPGTAAASASSTISAAASGAAPAPPDRTRTAWRASRRRPFRGPPRPYRERSDHQSASCAPYCSPGRAGDHEEQAPVPAETDPRRDGDGRADHRGRRGRRVPGDQGCSGPRPPRLQAGVAARAAHCGRSLARQLRLRHRVRPPRSHHGPPSSDAGSGSTPGHATPQAHAESESGPARSPGRVRGDVHPRSAHRASRLCPVRHLSGTTTTTPRYQLVSAATSHQEHRDPERPGSRSAAPPHPSGAHDAGHNNSRR